METVTGPIRVLSDSNMGLLHTSAVRMLEEVGMRIDHTEGLEALRAAGCLVDGEARTVRFPPAVTEEAVSRLRATFASPQAAIEPEKATVSSRVPMRFAAMYFTSMLRAIRPDYDANAGGFSPLAYDLDDSRRPATLEDVRDSIRIANGLESIDMIGLPCAAQDVPAALRSVVLVAELVKLTSKLGGIEAWSARDVDYITHIAEVVAGSSDAMRRHLILIGYAEARSPLCLDENMASVLIAYVKGGLPQSLDTMPATGTTAPAMGAGTLAVGLAETLGGAILACAINPDALEYLGICPTMTDMRSMIYPYAGSNRLPLVLAAMQMLTDYYGRPGGCHGGKIDACIPGVQAGIEKPLSIIFPVLAGATGVGTLGHVEDAPTFSFEQPVIDNEIAGYIHHALRGFEVMKETIAFDVLREIGIGGNYLAHEHAAKNSRSKVWSSQLMERLPWSAWSKQDVRGMEARARERARLLLDGRHARPLAPEQ